MKMKQYLALVILLLFPAVGKCYPPAPYHTFYGMVRDELGRPIAGDNTKVVFEVSSGKIIVSEVYNTKPGENYRLEIPMDSGSTIDLYNPIAMRHLMPYKIKILVGSKIFLPIEMIGEFSGLGRPGEDTMLNLTMGEDSDNDGLPDAWERSLLTKGQGLNDINPNDDTDGDGMSNINEYISGNYAFDKDDGLRLKIINQANGIANLEFRAVIGRTYSLYRSGNLKNWEQIEFRAQKNDKILKFYKAGSVENVRVEVINRVEGSNFYKLMVQ